MELLTSLGLPGLWLAAFLAATLLPLGAEWLVVTLVLNGFSPASVWLVASSGNVAGSWVNYAIGYYWGRPGIQRVFGVSDTALARADERFARWGKVTLLLAWVPVIGDPLTLIAGLLRVPLGWFLLLVALGKAGRYALVITLV